jgi:hypothetical protein
VYTIYWADKGNIFYGSKNSLHESLFVAPIVISDFLLL